MRIYAGERLYSAGDLVTFLGCRHATALDVRQLTEPVAFGEDDAQTRLLQEKGLAHERAYLQRLRDAGRSVVEIADSGSLEDRAARTLAAMQAGAEVVYQGALLGSPWQGYSDFLLKVDGTSAFGPWAYDVADTKLARAAKPSHVLQLSVYGDLLEAAQGRPPELLRVVLGDGGEAVLETASVRYYTAAARRRMEAFAAAPEATTAEPCSHCVYCRWKPTCEAGWETSDHLSRVTGLSRGQAAKLQAAGIGDLPALANASNPPADLNPEIFAKLRAQAAIQAPRRAGGPPCVELFPVLDGKGFARLPRPDPGDLFFDMEGDPLFDGGLEYLFGFTDAQDRFNPFWAHDRAAEKRAFEQAVDFLVAQLAACPNAHVYHYAAYEETALKRLAMYHGTREAEIDDLLRQGRLVDLYRVVREAVRTSEPGLSIKNLEVFYLDGGRGGEVKTAGESIVVYEAWRALQDPALLEEIAAYNALDCRSTRLCRDWLLSLRPQDIAWRPAGELKPPSPEKVREREDAEARTRALFEALVDRAPAADLAWRTLLANLLEFHRREAKPEWWAQFARRDMVEAELLDDPACLAQVRADADRPPRPEKRSMVRTFTFPPQDFKFKVGDKANRAGSGDAAGEVFAIDGDAGWVALKQGPSVAPLADGSALIPEGPVGDRQLRAAVVRYVETVLAGEVNRYRALGDILARRPPRRAGVVAGAAIVADGIDAVEGTLGALRGLDESYLLVQGPPGAGKTYVASHAIAALLKDGARIGVASNSHKAINLLLGEVEKAARTRSVAFRGVKKSSNEDQFAQDCPSIENTLDNGRAVDGAFQLYAGTAWLFARPEMDQRLDYLFVDEAGQVSLANIVAMGVAARNIVLVGDQMQLAQPIQGDHPGGSGVSALEHLMGDWATVPPDRGVFLAQTRRMAPDLCAFVSAAVYDGRLESHPDAQCQRLHLAPAAPECLASTGLRFQAVAHADCAQKSEVEAAAVAAAFAHLLRSEWTDVKGQRRPITVADVLVVSPYNMQVDLLRRRLPQGARVGTVDKLQGQEAAVVLISMATSSGDDLPRQIEFLYSRNRLNVAISRARCLAVIFASPRLLDVSCRTIAQMQLVNTLCWARDYADAAIERSLEG